MILFTGGYMLYLRCIKSNDNSFSALYCVEVLDLFCWKRLVGRVCFILLVSTKVWKIQFSHHVQHSSFCTLSIVLHIGKTFILCSVFQRILVQYWYLFHIFPPTSLNFNKLIVNPWPLACKDDQLAGKLIPAK